MTSPLSTSRRFFRSLFKLFYFVSFVILSVFCVYLGFTLKKNYALSKKILKQMAQSPLFYSLPGSCQKSQKFRELSHHTQDFVLDSQIISLEKDYCYNASLLKRESGGYYLFYRKDSVLPFGSYRTSLKMTLLDDFFVPSGKAVDLSKECKNAEDPRAFKIGDKIYCAYNELIEKPHFNRGMFLSQFDEKMQTLSSPLPLLFTERAVEKNWAPFFDSKSSENIHFVYEIIPLKIGTLNLKNETFDIETFSNSYSEILDSEWTPYFGAPRGGAPIISVSDTEYLNIFHSSIRDPKTRMVWYFMGAYTFEKNAPHKVTAFTPEPIFFSDAYETPPSNPLARDKKVLYPAGVVSDTKNGRDVLYVSCGENDASIKIITLDKNAFLKSMHRVSNQN